MQHGNDSEAKRLSALVLSSLDQGAEIDELARQAYRSRTQFFRLFQALIAESPGAMRRRFLLERAAFQLGRSRAPVTDIAFDAGYASLEAFTRAFGKAYGVSPSIYRRTGAWRIHLPAPNEFHYCGPQVRATGAHNMDLFELFAGTDSWYMKKMLEQAAQLSDEQLDRPQGFTGKVFGWEQPDQNLREILERMVVTKEVWVAALTKGPMPPVENAPAEVRTPQALLERSCRAEAEFTRVFREIRDRGAWDDTFVDALCEPPESFSFGGTFAHIITFNTHRRMLALDAFQRLGAPISGIGCPMDWERGEASSS